MLLDGTDISMVRGDNETIKVTMKKYDGTIIPFVEGDTVTLSVKEHARMTEYAFQKVVTGVTGDFATIAIEPADTNELDFKSYSYDIELKNQYNQIKTIIRSSKFEIAEEITNG